MALTSDELRDFFGRCAQARRPIPEFADITYSFNGGRSRYRAFQATFNWRAGQSMSVMNALTLSKAEDNGAGSLESNDVPAGSVTGSKRVR